ncbi:SAM hydroxide adenosyltransferase [Pelagicoccus mobilis]|uniref:S-adenosyl-l-methionine hydroxide adenosyltransferase C-terminal domain-containing protein n=1 Tax=Pelagicoccus mobilis TaxID=415221 RepID=A0A934RTR3_9BACT|nr:SAM hydroxide adenosyltransferase [Pelagicoccus mobilis]MBK1876221.1 hypothetical protein [Pelagicoccus mobilis]
MRLLLVTLLLFVNQNARGAIEQKQTVIEGAKASVLVDPELWNKKLIVVAHGYVPGDRPLLDPLNKNDQHFALFLESGWMVAATSYRRNGLIIRDAITDLELLYDWVVDEYDRPELTIVHGSSMGGMIVSLIAEQDQSRFDAALATGAALRLKEEKNPLALKHQPLIPLLFLSNRSEIKGPAAYQKKSLKNGKNAALWQVDRDGHVNLNTKERFQANQALELWLAKGEIELTRDGTIDMSPEKSGTELIDGVLNVPIRKIRKSYGNLTLDLIRSDLEAIGLKLGDRVKVTYQNQSHACLIGTSYGDVKVGEWVLFQRADGYYLLSRNFADAASTLGISLGDTIQLTLAEG